MESGCMRREQEAKLPVINTVSIYKYEQKYLRYFQCSPSSNLASDRASPIINRMSWYVIGSKILHILN
jgi:hypothetical protein